MKVSLEIDAVGDKIWEGVVDNISPSADPGIGSFMVKILVDNPSGILKPGMFVRVKIHTGSVSEYPSIPVSSIVQRENKNAVIQIVSENRITYRQIETGNEISGNVAVLSGLVQGELVVEHPDLLMEEGFHVVLE